METRSFAGGTGIANGIDEIRSFLDGPLFPGAPVTEIGLAAGRGDTAASFVDVVREHTEGFAGAWQVEMPDGQFDAWVRVSHTGASTPAQGWKLHVSANVRTAEAVLRRALPVLLADAASFKLAASPNVLGALNQGEAGLSQVGKFITVYPNDDAHAVALALAIDEATRGLDGPAVPSDRPLAPGSLVHYRYGGFDDRVMTTRFGEIIPAISDPAGRLIPDPRGTAFRPPVWAVDPFVAAGITAPQETSRLAGGRFLITATPYRSPRGAIHLALDLDRGQECVLKEALRGAVAGPDARDAFDYLRHEAAILERLAPDPAFPRPIALFDHEGNLILAMELVHGEPLGDNVARSTRFGRYPSGMQVVEWGRQLAAALGRLHARGLVYRDLKAGNIMITPDGRVRLIDFELVAEPASGIQHACIGSRGYCSPQQVANHPSAVTDDVYGFGAVLYFMATGAEPGISPHPFKLLARPVTLLNPAIGPELERVIARCLALDPADRFPSMADIDAALAALGSSAGVDAPAIGRERRTEDVTIRARHRAIAGRLGDSLAAEAGQTDGPTGGGNYRDRSLYSGDAGVVFALAELVDALGEPRHRDALGRAAAALADSATAVADPWPGLYMGEAGVAAALLRAGQVLRSKELIAAAAAHGQVVAGLAAGGLDIVAGVAGHLELQLQIWDETGDDSHLAIAVRDAELLMRAAETADGGALFWPGSLEPGESGPAYLGFAHGAAGIAAALLDLFETTGDGRLRAQAQGAARWLAGQAVPVLDDGSGLNWPDVAGNPPAGALWCHGATGIGQFFLHAAAHDLIPEAGEMALGAARTVARGARSTIGPARCHGLAGSIDFLLDVARFTGDAAWAAEATSLGCLLEAFLQERNGALVSCGDTPSDFTPSFMTGYGGVALAFLRLSDPDQIPAPLSSASGHRSHARHAPHPSC